MFPCRESDIACRTREKTRSKADESSRIRYTISLRNNRRTRFVDDSSARMDRNSIVVGTVGLDSVEFIAQPYAFLSNADVESHILLLHRKVVRSIRQLDAEALGRAKLGLRWLYKSESAKI